MKGTVNTSPYVGKKEYDELLGGMHTHANKEALDKVTDEKIKKWDSAGAGDVTGPESAADGNIAAFDGTTGKIIKDGNIKAADIKELTDIKEEIKEIVESGGGGGGGGTGDGDVKGPASAADGELPVYDGTTGKKIKAGGVRMINDTLMGAGTSNYHCISFEADKGFRISARSTSGDAYSPEAYVSSTGIHIGTTTYRREYAGSVSIGIDANVDSPSAMQLGAGTNKTTGSLQFRDFPVVLGEDEGHYLNTVGKVTDLKTSAKTDVVAAINELKQKFDDIVDGNEVQY